MEGAAKEYEGHSDQQVSNNNKNGEDDYGDWIKVQNNRKKERSDGTYNRRSVFERLSINKPTSFFFTRFPESWDSRTLWKIFEEYGKIVDVYIPEKRTKMGTRFGFARFVNISDVQAFEKKLGEIQVGKTKLLINIAKYGREKENTNKEVKKVVTEVQKNNHIHMGAKYNGRSYREVTTGSTPAKEKVLNSNNVLEIQSTQNQLCKLKKCWVGKVRSIDTLRNIWSLFQEEGLVDCIIHYIGGLSILCEWKSEDIAKKSLEKNYRNIMQWMQELSMWKEEAGSPGRLTWLDMEGIPILAWNKQAIRSIASEFGCVLEVDDVDIDSPIMNSIGALIHTFNMAEISTVLPVKINNTIWNVKIAEDHNRSLMLNTPNCLDKNSVEGGDSVDDIQDNGDDDYSVESDGNESDEFSDEIKSVSQVSESDFREYGGSGHDDPREHKAGETTNARDEDGSVHEVAAVLEPILTPNAAHRNSQDEKVAEKFDSDPTVTVPNKSGNLDSFNDLLDPPVEAHHVNNEAKSPKAKQPKKSNGRMRPTKSYNPTTFRLRGARFGFHSFSEATKLSTKVKGSKLGNKMKGKKLIIGNNDGSSTSIGSSIHLDDQKEGAKHKRLGKALGLIYESDSETHTKQMGTDIPS
ncbi:hypothetical protein CTI12_AA026760 [Artemisia annua]|uniref:RRM domain-containing protein n=1 Tax=Artemisia annua TaxID=35608 RepID=A0A2U1QIA1_ARTAN|nr:hypothetical protein CTI12_AA026760 [Artemisia annua]